jgi:hypothetical protein
MIKELQIYFQKDTKILALQMLKYPNGRLLKPKGIYRIPFDYLHTK